MSSKYYAVSLVVLHIAYRKKGAIILLANLGKEDVAMQSIKEKLTFDFRSDMLFSKAEVWAILLPVVLETLLSYLIGLADSVMVSEAGEAAVSAVSMIDAISVLFINVFAALANGGAVVCGQHLGKKDELGARSSAEHTMLFLFVSSGVITALMLIFRTQLLELLYGSVDDEVMYNCEVYYRIVMLSIPCIALYNGGAALHRTSGDSKTPLKISIYMNIINVAGNALLIYVFRMGVAGVAVPTLVSRFVAMAAMLVMSFRRDFIFNIRGIRHFRFDRKLFSSTLSVGVPNGIENGMFQFGKLILTSLVATLTTAAITANAIGNTVGNLHCVIGVSANSALMAVVSRCVGAGDYTQARWYTRYIVMTTYVLEGLFNLLFIAAIPLILKLYGVSAETASLTVPILLLHGITTIIMWPAAFMFNISMRSAGDSKYAMWIASISMWLCRVGGAYVMIKLLGTGVIGVWIAWAIDWCFRIAFFIPRYLGHKWETKALV